MRDKTLMGGLILLGAGILFITLIYTFFLQPAELPSAPIAAVPLDGETGSLALYEINPAESEASFRLEEELRGLPTTVIGTTSQVSGQIAVDPDNLSTARMGTIRINARTFVTDNNFRNNAIRNRILFSDAFEYITFTPTAIDGLPPSTRPGVALSFQIRGDLTIRETTRPATFAVTAVIGEGNRLTGTATATIQRADFNLQIPYAAGVANVSEDVTLSLDFVADRIE